MKENEQASLSIKKIALITLVLIFLLGLGVKATTANIHTVKIVLADTYQIEVITTKKVVSEILEENHIIVLPTENVVPNLESEINDKNSIITISSTEKAVEIVKLADEYNGVSMEQLLSNYSPIVEKIITETEEIPYSIVNKKGKEVDVENSKENYKTVKKGTNGVKQIINKVKYKNDIEIEKITLDESIIKEPVNEVVSVAVVSTRSSTTSRVTNTNGSNIAEKLSSLVEGIEPKVKTLNTSAYTASTCGKSPSSPSYGKTSSGAMASAWYTVAAGKSYPVGTIIYIPYFSNQPNGGWFMVQDRGGAIKDNKLDVYMNTYNECVNFGRRNLECYIYVR